MNSIIPLRDWDSSMKLKVKKCLSKLTTVFTVSTTSKWPFARTGLATLVALTSTSGSGRPLTSA